jgi:tRNA(Ile)-lysidine synthase
MLEQRVLDFFTDVCPVAANDGLLVAVSGGPDSVTLLHLLLEIRDSLGVRLELAHLDHGLRGTEGEEDLRFVERLADRERLPLHRRRVDVGALIEDEGGSVEATARRERYRFFEEAQGVAGARWTVTGHNADDQIETFLLNLLRGAGPRGLGGMLAVGPGSICRPLLTTWRAEILEYLENHELEYREDASNRDISLTRNRIRHRLVPLLTREFGEASTRVLARESLLMNELDEYLSLESERILQSALRGPAEGSTVELSIPALAAEHPVLQRSAVRLALDSVFGGLQEVTLAHMDAVLELIQGPGGSGSIDLPRGIQVRREYETIALSSVSQDGGDRPEASPPLDLTRSGTLRWGGIHLAWTVCTGEDVDPMDWSSQPTRSCFDLDALTGPAYLRAARQGDRIEPYGMSGSQKVSNLLIDRKVPRRLRTRTALLCDNGGPADGERILWVAGQRRGRHATVGPGTARVVLFEAEPMV